MIEGLIAFLGVMGMCVFMLMQVNGTNQRRKELREARHRLRLQEAAIRALVDGIRDVAKPLELIDTSSADSLNGLATRCERVLKQELEET